jgi:hypothetical protein
MRARVSLVSSLVLLAACGERVIGSAHAPDLPDGGLSASNADRVLAGYAVDLGGRWRGMSEDGAATFLVEFTPSSELPRSGTVRSELEVDCEVAVPALFPLPVPVCEADDGRPRRPQDPYRWEAEYWLLKLQGANATLSMLPDTRAIMGFSFTCLYVPRQEPDVLPQPRLECGVTLLGFPLFEMVLTQEPA